MISKVFLFLSLVVCVSIQGCTHSTGPSTTTPQLKEGEFGFVIGDSTYDSKNNPLHSTTVGSITDTNRKILSFELNYFSGGRTLNITITLPFKTPQPQTYAIGQWGLASDSTDATASESLDSAFNVSIPGGRITITSFDTIKNEVSGTFDFKTLPRYSASNDTVTIASGYFNEVTIDQGGYNQGSLSMMIDGFNFFAPSGPNATLAAYEIAGQNGITFIASDNDASFLRVLSIIVPEPKVGTFYFVISPKFRNQASANYTLNPAPGNDTLYSINATAIDSDGTITITSYDTLNRRISATFSFSAESIATGGQIQNAQWAIE